MLLPFCSSMAPAFFLSLLTQVQLRTLTPGPLSLLNLDYLDGISFDFYRYGEESPWITLELSSLPGSVTLAHNLNSVEV